MMTARFIKEIRSGNFNNSLDQAIKATMLFNIMENHFNGSSKKCHKLLFIGYDGCLASAVAKSDKNHSAIYELASQGGLYLGRTGGEKVGDQETDTAPGWASIFTGAWAEEHGVYNNSNVLSGKTSIMLKLALTGIPVSFSFSWDAHKNITYKNEVSIAPKTFIYCDDDLHTLESMRKSLKNGYKAVFGIFEHCDHEGHNSGFSTKNIEYMEALAKSEDFAKILINDIKKSPSYENEDWLIIIASDHGGKKRVHGGKSKMESTVFFASNKKIFDD
jgi:predicted AlkP superfamily pyrophosphatase or phosphodiesterase